MMRALFRGFGPLAGPLLALVLGGCATLSGFERSPRVTLVNLQPVQIQFLEQRYLATLRIQNPNPVELPIEGLDYSISINGSPFGDGVSSQRVTVPAYGETTLDVSITSTIARLFDQIRRLRSSGGTLSYSITGTVGLQGRLGSVPFEEQGEVDLRLHTPPAERAT